MMNKQIAWRFLIVLSGVGCLSTVSGWYFGSIEGLALFLRGQSIFVDRSSLDLGAVSVSKETLVPFKLSNKSSQAVEVVGGRASCSCAVPEDLPITIRSFDSVVLSIRYKPPEQTIGSTVQNNVNLFLSNGQEPLRLSFTATITE